ncbi:MULTISPECIES: SAM-dependent methyltransferase [Pseudonocardia]|uniref:Methyltransferase domain-containing protein n=2 Tax=Pseudonocardia TaxID=1847 RepID=A0A1Y2MKQ0_PSEAH|nr:MULTISPECIES: SAM-dependent methyltransferase [Pseudonocardia]OSY35621.1 hypothetical protein BG845_05956 [Pseudonocardia autotrophica]TDN76912.1 hypothetical protein C8E95_6132 [Pseudonocardia autotrophica]BBG00915.1 trans-aconitate methyltransferase [Pseudonocardia autotrophica]GEC27526.1 trans-aconitate methyltransferase [Pseudonocardia saturnea]
MSVPLQGAAGSQSCPPDWLALREPADSDARSTALAEALSDALPPGPLLVRDLGCGTGSMARWLAPRLAAPPGDRPGRPDQPSRPDQHWMLHDRDADLLRHAVAGLPDGVTGAAAPGDLTALDAAALAGTSLVTASALLDMLTAEEIDRLAEACTRAGVPALLTLSVSGRVCFDPPDPLDGEFAAAFDDHQRRETGGRRLLGPDAATVAAEALRRRGALVRTADAPWRLGPDRPDLLREWLAGWLDAACAQRPELHAAAGPYRDRRHREIAAGALAVTVGHTDLLALPG